MDEDSEKRNRMDEVPPEVRRKAQRTIWILYAIMAVLVLLPFLMLLFV